MTARSTARRARSSARIAALAAAAALLAVWTPGADAAPKKKAAKPADAKGQPANTAAAIAEAIKLYDSGDYEKALPLLERAEKDSKLAQKDRITVLKFQAFIHIMMNATDPARTKVETIYLIDPGFELAANDLPYFRKFFEGVKRDYLAKHKPGAAAPKPASGPPPASPFESYRKAVERYDNGEYDEALNLFTKVEQTPAIDRGERVVVLKYQAFIFIMTNRDDAARRKVTEIYDLNPGFELGASDLPYFKKFFANVKHDLGAKPPERGLAAGAAGEGMIEGEGGATEVRKVGPEGRPNVFVRFWPSWACLIAGAAAIGPGIYLGLTSTDDRKKLEDTPRDARGRLIGVTAADLKKMQDDASQKALIANIVMGAGGAVMATGAAMFFIYDGAGKPPPVTFDTDGRGGAVNVSWSF